MVPLTYPNLLKLVKAGVNYIREIARIQLPKFDKFDYIIPVLSDSSENQFPVVHHPLYKLERLYTNQISSGTSHFSKVGTNGDPIPGLSTVEANGNSPVARIQKVIQFLV